MIEKERVEFGLFSTQISREWQDKPLELSQCLPAIQGYCSFS
jgi:hypothetical protein